MAVATSPVQLCVWRWVSCALSRRLSVWLFWLVSWYRTPQAATEVDWASSLPGVSVTVSNDKGSALSRVYAVSDVDATYAAVKQGLTKRGWTVQDAASTVVTGASVHALVATREGRRLSVSVQAATGVSPTMSLHLNRAVGQAPAHTGGRVTTSP